MRQSIRSSVLVQCTAPVLGSIIYGLNENRTCTEKTCNLTSFYLSVSVIFLLHEKTARGAAYTSC